ncbi:major facilitator superfamily transporter [Fusarium tricinctum]|uniref:Major facilitator superfamily transporter n=1 Tax=Fusarium tricinctum TaxID=61284 RepID=A0A8K0WB67_9HYPO|nr:major facilitator superfamily transporter [Fusarium tricinctum]
MQAAPEPIPDGGTKAWIQVSCSWIILADSWGLVNSFGMYQTYYENGLLSDTTSSAISWIGSLQGALLLILAPVSGTLYDAGYFRALLLSGLSFIIFGQFVTSFATAYWQILLPQGICIGLGCGLVYVPSTAILSQYFQRRRALVIGIASTGSPIVGIVFPVIFGKLQPVIGFSWATRLIALILLAISIIPAVAMHPRIKQKAKVRSFIDMSAVQDPVFALVIVGSFFVFLTLYVAFFYIQLFAIQHDITSIDFSSYLLMLLNSGSIPGRVAPNYLADRLGALRIQLSVTTISAAIMFIWLGVHNLGGLIVFALAYGLFSGGVVSVTPCLIVALSPQPDKIGTRMGMIFFVMGLAVLIGTPIAGALLGSGDGTNWRNTITYGGCSLMIGALGYTGATFISWKQRGHC